MTYTYKHISKETGICFYVGQTHHAKVRPYQLSKPSRSDKWMLAYEKHCQSKRDNLIIEVIEHKNEGDALKQEWHDINDIKPDGNTRYVSDKIPKNGDFVAVVKETFIANANTDGFIDLTSLVDAGNIWRGKNGKKPYQLGNFTSSSYLQEYIKSASKIWDKPEQSFIKTTGRGRNSSTWGHVSIAILLAEQLSSDFHASVHKVFIDGKLLENRLYGGEEFKRLNEALLDYLPSPRGNDDSRRIKIATLIREKCKLEKPEDDEIPTWNQEAADSVAQAKRAEIMVNLVKFLKLGLVKDFNHLKELIEKM